MVLFLDFDKSARLPTGEVVIVELEMLVGYAVLFIGISLLIEGWREVYLATREGRLATEGLYSVVRHPQYTGIFLAVFGQMIHWPTIPTLALFPVIVWAYYRLAKRAEQQMLEQFGAQYAAVWMVDKGKATAKAKMH